MGLVGLYEWGGARAELRGSGERLCGQKQHLKLSVQIKYFPAESNRTEPNRIESNFVANFWFESDRIR